MEVSNNSIDKDLLEFIKNNKPNGNAELKDYKDDIEILSKNGYTTNQIVDYLRDYKGIVGANDIDVENIIVINKYNIEMELILNEINKMELFSTKVALNQKECAGLIGVSSSTLEHWRKESNLKSPPFIKMGDEETKGRVLYSKVGIAEWLLSNNKEVVVGKNILKKEYR